MKYLLFFPFILSSCLVSAQTIRGFVTDNSGKAIISANISIIKGGSKKALISSSENGSFAFSIRLDTHVLVKNYDTLLCTRVGFKPRKEIIQNNNIVNFILEKDIQSDTIFSSCSVEEIINGEAVIGKQKLEALEEMKKKGMDVEDYNKVFTAVEIHASYPGGNDAVRRYFQKNISEIKINSIHSTYSILVDENHESQLLVIKIGCTIAKDGKVANVSILKGIDKILDSSIANVFEKMPAWKPAIQNGKEIEEYKEFVFPMRFILPRIICRYPQIPTRTTPIDKNIKKKKNKKKD